MRVEDDVGEGRGRMAERVRQGMGAGTLIGEGDRPLHLALPLSYSPAGPMASLPWLALPWHEVRGRMVVEGRVSMGVRGRSGTGIGPWYYCDVYAYMHAHVHDHAHYMYVSAYT